MGRSSRGCENRARAPEKPNRLAAFDIMMVGLQALKEKIQFEKELPTHEEADAFICVVMSHGNRNGIIRTSNWEEFDVRKELVEAFQGEHWPVMIDKPKIFLFQICRDGKCLHHVFYFCHLAKTVSC